MCTQTIISVQRPQPYILYTLLKKHLQGVGQIDLFQCYVALTISSWFTQLSFPLVYIMKPSWNMNAKCLLKIFSKSKPVLVLYLIMYPVTVQPITKHRNQAFSWFEYWISNFSLSYVTAIFK